MNKTKLAKILANLDFYAYQYSSDPDSLRIYIAAVIKICGCEEEFTIEMFNDVSLTPQVKEAAERGYQRIKAKLNTHDEIYL